MWMHKLSKIFLKIDARDVEYRLLEDIQKKVLDIVCIRYLDKFNLIIPVYFQV